MFDYPGDGINGILASWGRADNDPQFVQSRHEEMSAFEAVGYAKFTDRIGVCMATSGPGAVHLLNGLYDARRIDVAARLSTAPPPGRAVQTRTPHTSATPAPTVRFSGVAVQVRRIQTAYAQAASLTTRRAHSAAVIFPPVPANTSPSILLRSLIMGEGRLSAQLAGNPSHATQKEGNEYDKAFTVKRARSDGDIRQHRVRRARCRRQRPLPDSRRSLGSLHTRGAKAP